MLRNLGNNKKFAKSFAIKLLSNSLNNLKLHFLFFTIYFTVIKPSKNAFFLYISM